MKYRLFHGTLLFAAAVLLVAQTPHPPVLVADDGSVIPAHRSVHRKRGEAVTWGRQTAGQSSWYVRFAESPCREGAEFGSGHAARCTISVACQNAGDAACKSYPYSSSLSPTGPLHDPDIVVDR